VAGADLLQVRSLTVRYAGTSRPAIEDFDLNVDSGECVAVVGPSGSGKSTICRALLNLLPPTADWTGSIRWQGQDLGQQPRMWRRMRGRGLGLVLQDHRHALDPVFRIGDQVSEVVKRHRPDLDRAARWEITRSLLAEVRLPDTTEFARRYPHQMSGGQRQRVGIAAALAAEPRLLLADEPTTALDLVVQRDIMALLIDLVHRRGLALLLVSHDRDLVALLADRVVDLESAGKVGGSPQATAEPALIAAATGPCLVVRGLTVTVAGPRGRHPVVEGVDLDLNAGKTLGLAGESGAGKTTLARALAGWHPIDSGSMDLVGGPGGAPSARRRAVQLVSQDPAAALDPRQTVLAAVTEAARATGCDADAARQGALRLLDEVELGPELAGRRPGTLSGGQRQRLQLARALATQPRVLVADEPASSLDPRLRRRLLDLMKRVQRRQGLALLLISHDLPFLERWSDQVAVMLAGKVVELYSPGYVESPRHPFARDLAAAAPARLSCLHGSGSPTDGELETNQQPPPNGCPYALRCDLVQPACRTHLPDLRDLGAGHLVRCPEVDRHVR